MYIRCIVWCMSCIWVYISVYKVYINCIWLYPRARMGSESIAHSAFGLMGYWLRGHEGETNNCFSKIQLVGQKYREWKNFSHLKVHFNPFLSPKNVRFSLLVGYNLKSGSSSTKRNAVLIITTSWILIKDVNRCIQVYTRFIWVYIRCIIGVWGRCIRCIRCIWLNVTWAKISLAMD